MSAFVTKLKQLNACSEAIDWITKNNYTFEQAWNNCHRPDWMYWLIGRTKLDRKLVVLSAVECAELAIEFVNEDSLLAVVWCLDATRRWCEGEDNLDEVQAAADAAAAAADAAAAYVAYAARTKMNKKCAAAIRSGIPFSIIKGEVA